MLRELAWSYVTILYVMFIYYLGEILLDIYSRKKIFWIDLAAVIGSNLTSSLGSVPIAAWQVVLNLNL